MEGRLRAQGAKLILHSFQEGRCFSFSPLRAFILSTRFILLFCTFCGVHFCSPPSFSFSSFASSAWGLVEVILRYLVFISIIVIFKCDAGGLARRRRFAPSSLTLSSLLSGPPGSLLFFESFSILWCMVTSSLEPTVELDVVDVEGT